MNTQNVFPFTEVEAFLNENLEVMDLSFILGKFNVSLITRKLRQGNYRKYACQPIASKSVKCLNWSPLS